MLEDSFLFYLPLVAINISIKLHCSTQAKLATMKTKRCSAAILLMFSVEAIVAGTISAALTDDGRDTIRLRSHGNNVVNAPNSLLAGQSS
jgi:hypothetical protein